MGDPSQIDKIIDSSESHILNLLNLLSRYSILQYKDTTDGNGYYWTGKIPSEIFDKPDYLLTAEKAFVNEFGLLIEIVNNIDDLQTNNDIGEYDEIFQGHDASEITGLNAYPVFNKYNSYYIKLLKTVPEHVIFDNLKTYTKELSEFNKKLFDNYLQILANLIKIRLKKVNFAISKLTANQNFLPTLSEFKSLLMKFEHFIIYSPDLSRQIIIFHHFDIQDVVASQTIKLIKDQENTILLITISRNKSEPIDKISIKHKQEIGLLKNGKPKYKVQSITLRNYKNFHFQDSFQIFFEIYNFIDNWLNK